MNVRGLSDVRSRRAWSLFALAALLVAVSFFSYGGRLVYLWRHIGLVLLLPLPTSLAAWLVIQAHDAQELQPCQTCRRR
jgi:hypothetical protein